MKNAKKYSSWKLREIKVLSDKVTKQVLGDVLKPSTSNQIIKTYPSTSSFNELNASANNLYLIDTNYKALDLLHN